MKLDSIINGELNLLKAKIDKDHCLSNFKIQLSSTIANVFFIYFCSKRFDTSISKFQEMVKSYDTIFYEVNQGYASDFLPWLCYFQSKNHKKTLSRMSKSIRAFFMEYLINERMAKFNLKEKKAEEDDEDYVDSLLNNVFNNEEKPSMTLDKALYSLEDIVGGHTAISNFIMKTLGFLVSNPDVQAKIQEEVDAMTLNSRPVSLADRKQMPYTEATILESIRTIASPIVPHAATQDSSIGGE